MNILITGSSGFIGNKLKNYFSLNHNVFCIQRKPDSIGDKNVFNIDLTKLDAVNNVLKNETFNQINIDVIIHCAALLADENNINSISLFNDNNKITESVITLALHFKPKKLLNFSTIGVYPNKDGSYTEVSEINPSANAECLYSLSKFCSEELFKFYLKNIEVVNLRLSQTYGDGMRADRMYSNYLAELKNKNEICVWGNGERVSNFISINYLIEKVDLLLKQNNFSGTLNLGQKNISYLDLAKMIINEHGNENSKIVLIDKGVKSKVYINCSKIDKLLNNEQK